MFWAIIMEILAIADRDLIQNVARTVKMAVVCRIMAVYAIVIHFATLPEIVVKI